MKNTFFFAFSCEDEKVENEVYEFYREFSKLRIDRNMKIKGIAKRELKQRFLDRGWPHEDVLFVDFPTIRNASVCGNRVVFYSLGQTPGFFPNLFK